MDLKEPTRPYQQVLGLTQQFVTCGNAFRLDSWSGCSYGCRYCFVTQKGRGDRKEGMGDVSVLWRALEVAFEEGLRRTIEWYKSKGANTA